MAWADGSPALGRVVIVEDGIAEVLLEDGGSVKRPLEEVAFVNLPTFPPASFEDVPPDAADYLDAPAPRYHK